MNGVTISRRFDFSASHRYYREDWTEEKNRLVFGLCALPNGHGHNYSLEISVTGIPDPATGMVINLADLKSVVDDVLTNFDHKHLNLDTIYFIDKQPTTENFAAVLWELVANRLDGAHLTRLRLYETEDLYVEYFGETA